MSDAQAAVLAAAITGGVAFVAIVGSVITTWLNLRYQRNAESQRRVHERQMRVFDSGLRAAVDFLAAADRTTRARQAMDTAQISLDQSKSSQNQQLYDQLRALWEQARAIASAAIDDAENAYAALRLLVPEVADQGRRYLDLCRAATAHPDDTKVDRQRARQMVEQTMPLHPEPPQAKRHWWSKIFCGEAEISLR